MKHIILGTLVLTITALIFLVYTKGDRTFGPSSVAIISVLVAFSFFCIISLIVYRSNKREAIVRIWLALISSLVVYLAMDLGLGYFFISPVSPPIILDEHVHHRLAPNTSSEYKSRDFHYIQRVNGLGLRGSDIQSTKEKSTYRVLMLGDSFTMGKGVGDHQTFSALLQDSLNRHVDAINRKRFEVLNAGVDSYAPILSFLQLKQLAGSLVPDLIVLNLDMSDLLQEVVYRKLATYGSDGQIVGVRSEELGQDGFSKALITVRNWVDSDLYFSRLIRFYVQKWGTSSSEPSVRNMVWFASRELLRHTLADDELDRTDQWQNIFASILSMKKYCDSHGMTFLLTIYPWGHQVNEKEWIPQRWDFIPHGARVSDRSIRIVEDFAEANSIALLNVFAAFRAYNGGRPLYYGEDMHWTPAGHELMARELERFMLSQIIGTR